jgi:uncharacterized protein involved in outer membrane biogenesis
MGRILKFVALAAVALVVLLVAALYYPFDSPGLGRTIASAVANATGAELKASAFTVQAARRITATDVELTMDTPGGRVSIRVDALELEHHLWPLLRGEVIVDRVLIDQPVIEVTSKPAPASPAGAATPAPSGTAKPAPAEPPPTSGGKPMRLAMDSFAIRNAKVTLQTEGRKTPDTEVSGLTLELGGIAIDPAASPRYAGLAGTGSLSISTVRWGKEPVTDIKGKVSVASGRVQITDAGLQSVLGGASLNATLDAAAVPHRAEGVLQLSPGPLPKIKALTLLDQALGTSVVGTRFEAAPVKFALTGNRLQIQPFTLSGKSLRLGLEGSVEASGPIALVASVGVPRAEVKPERELSRQTLDALTDASGWMTFPVSVTGTADDPSIAPDMDAIKHAVAKGAKATAKAGVEKVVHEQLGGMIRRKTGR